MRACLGFQIEPLNPDVSFTVEQRRNCDERCSEYIFKEDTQR